jgi:uncharacterized protein YbjT (DUF2867 family)
VFVAGATGATGRRVVARLLARGDAPVALARDPAAAQARLGTSVEVVRGDVRTPETLAGHSCEAAICAIGSRSYYGGNGLHAVDAAGTAALAGALARDGVRHLVLVSAFGLDRTSVFLRIFSAALNGYFAGKAAAEQAVRSAGNHWTILRPVEFTNRPPRGLPRLNQGEPLSLLRLVSRDTVASVAVGCAGNPLAFDRTFELCEGGRGTLDEQLARLAPEPTRPRPPNTPIWGA